MLKKLMKQILKKFLLICLKRIKYNFCVLHLVFFIGVLNLAKRLFDKAVKMPIFGWIRY